LNILTTYKQRDDKQYYFLHEESIDLKDTWMGSDATVGEIYRASLKEHGRCTGRVYVDYLHGDSKFGPYHVGWVFEKRQKYEDSSDTYILEVWVSLVDKDETHRVIEYHAI